MSQPEQPAFSIQLDDFCLEVALILRRTLGLDSKDQNDQDAALVHAPGQQGQTSEDEQ